jgi:Kef-type K+ transport system membrane component KefB
MTVSMATAYVVGDVALILLLSSVAGWLAVRLGQPAVVGQILVGIAVGSAALQQLPGHLSARFFPTPVLPFLSVLAQVAVVIFMFGVGYEIDLRELRRNRVAVPVVAAGSLVPPLLLGAAVALVGTRQFERIGEPYASHGTFVLFLAVSVSVSALPVMAAVIRDRGIAGSRASVVATTAAGVMDVVCWLALAFLTAGAGSSGAHQFWLTLGRVAALVLGLVLIARPLLRWWLDRPQALLVDQVPVAVILAMACAWAASRAGIDVIFGGFLAGLIMPRRDGTPDADVLRQIDRVGSLLLPLFFVVTGLSLKLDSIGARVLVIGLVLLVVAIAGKLGTGYLSARAARLDHHDAAVVAALVNTRGLTELVVLNIGLATHLIHRELFAVLVFIALITTLMTGPILGALGVRRPSNGNRNWLGKKLITEFAPDEGLEIREGLK